VSNGTWTDTGNLFRFLADGDFHDASPLYERLARAAADDEEIVSLLDAAAPADRLPHLLFAAGQYLLFLDGSDPLEAFGSSGYDTFRAWCLDRRTELSELIATHVLQTNEVGRCAAVLPCLARIAAVTARPLALIEVGASAGLNLRLDRYRYRYDDEVLGAASSAVQLEPRLEGGLAPSFTVPEIVWRQGLDRRPVDVMDDDAVTWLRACVWPEQRWRADLLETAVAEARVDPPRVVAGDAIAGLPELVAAAPPDADLCILHTAVLGYLPDRAGFVSELHELGRERPLWWVSGEAAGLVDTLPRPEMALERLSFLYGVVPIGHESLSAQVLAAAGAHVAWLAWLDPVSARPRP
jgi:hypothetical protein